MMKVDPQDLKCSPLMELEGVNECTGASLVADSLLIMQKTNVWVYEL